MESLISRSVTPQVGLEYHLAEELWLCEIDAGDFQDAMINLVLNARDAMGGHGQLILKTINSSFDDSNYALNPDIPPGDYVQLVVGDTGKGIAHNQLELIFEPFFTTKDEGKGTGLGLAMVYGFVTRSGGHIKVKSDLGTGTTFRIYLPRAEQKDEQVNLNSEQLESDFSGTEVLLLVDDERGLLELAQESLEDLGYQVLTAKDGSEALRRLDENPNIKLLFSDVVMPGGMNGYELAEKACARYPALKVLLTSGHAANTTVSDDQAYFDENLLPKPYNQRELAMRVRQVIGDVNA